MYTVPSYVTYRTEEDAIYITSELYRNTVRLTDHHKTKSCHEGSKKVSQNDWLLFSWLFVS